MVPPAGGRSPANIRLGRSFLRLPTARRRYSTRTPRVAGSAALSARSGRRRWRRPRRTSRARCRPRPRRRRSGPVHRPGQTRGTGRRATRSGRARLADLDVRRRTLPPSASMRKIANVPSRSLANAIVAPSGDQAGSSSALSSSVSWSSDLPFGRIVQMSLEPSRSDVNAMTIERLGPRRIRVGDAVLREPDQVVLADVAEEDLVVAVAPARERHRLAVRRPAGLAILALVVGELDGLRAVGVRGANPVLRRPTRCCEPSRDQSGWTSSPAASISRVMSLPSGAATTMSVLSSTSLLNAMSPVGGGGAVITGDGDSEATRRRRTRTPSGAGMTATFEALGPVVASLSPPRPRKPPAKTRPPITTIASAPTTIAGPTGKVASGAAADGRAGDRLGRGRHELRRAATTEDAVALVRGAAGAADHLAGRRVGRDVARLGLGRWRGRAAAADPGWPESGSGSGRAATAAAGPAGRRRPRSRSTRPSTRGSCRTSRRTARRPRSRSRRPCRRSPHSSRPVRDAGRTGFATRPQRV